VTRFEKLQALRFAFSPRSTPQLQFLTPELTGNLPERANAPGNEAYINS